MNISKTGDRCSVSVVSNLSDETQQLANQLDANNNGVQDSFVSVIPKKGTRSPEFLADFLQTNAEKMGVKLSYGEALQITRAVAAEENNADKNITIRNFTDIVLKPQMITLIHNQFPNLDAENVGTALAITLDPQMSIAPPRALAPKGPMTIPQLMEFVEAGLGDDPASLAVSLAQLELMRATIAAQTADQQLVRLSNGLLGAVQRLVQTTTRGETNAQLEEVRLHMAELRSYLGETDSGILQKLFGAAEEMMESFQQSPKLIVLAFAIGAAVAVGVEELVKRRGTPGEPPPPEKKPPEKRPCISGTKMIPIPGGSFMMGTKKGGDKDERPTHKVTLSPFSLDEHSVTVEQYSACMLAQGEEQPKLPPEYNVPKFPVTLVDWGQANAYCKLVGKRLPTEAEQEYVAKGPEHNFEYATRDGTQPTPSQARYAAGSPVDVCS